MQSSSTLMMHYNQQQQQNNINRTNIVGEQTTRETFPRSHQMLSSTQTTTPVPTCMNATTTKTTTMKTNTVGRTALPTLSELLGTPFSSVSQNATPRAASVSHTNSKTHHEIRPITTAATNLLQHSRSNEHVIAPHYSTVGENTQNRAPSNMYTTVTMRPTLQQETKKEGQPVPLQKGLSSFEQQELAIRMSTFDELQLALKKQEHRIKMLENENMYLKSELKGVRSFQAIQTSNRTATPNTIPPKPIAVVTQQSLKRKSSPTCLSNQLYNDSPTEASASEDEDFYSSSPNSPKKRKVVIHSFEPSEHRDEKKKRSNISGKRDATVGETDKYKVTWKGETYVLVNAFRNRTQILNYYVPLYQNNFPEKTCKIVLCNEEYKQLSNENPHTVEKKKHAWRVSVFTMDFYNFVKNFDKSTLKIIHSSSGYIPNESFDSSNNHLYCHSPNALREDIVSNTSVSEGEK